MIISALCRYYDILEKDANVSIARFGYSSAKVSFVLLISSEGRLLQILDLRGDHKRPKPKNINVPFQKARASKVFPYFICDNAKYIFGVEKQKRDAFEKKLKALPEKEKASAYTVLEAKDKELILITPRSKACFKAFKSLHHEILDGLEEPEVLGLLSFLDRWNPEEFLKKPKLSEYKEELLAGRNCVFGWKGKYLHQKPEVKAAWEKYYHEVVEGNSVAAQCLVSGKIEPVAKIHQKIKGVEGAQAAGASLVSFNEEAFCSYGKKQGFNAPISEAAMFKYTTALNYLLSNQSHKIRIADSTVVFWAERAKPKEKTCEELVKLFINPPNLRKKETALNMEKKKGQEPEISQIEKLQKLKQLKGILNKVRSGKKINQEELKIDPETNFYILGLSPNNARLAVSFWNFDCIGNIIEKLAQYQLDMEIIKGDSALKYVSVDRLLKETLPKGSDKKEVYPLLGSLVLRSLFTDTVYPRPLYSAILKKIKGKSSINSVRAGFIKAYLLSLSRAGLTDINQALITVSLNEESQNSPYRLGRLFAVLEKAQNKNKNNTNINNKSRARRSSIISKYFSRASARPAEIFPELLKLSQSHRASVEEGFKLNQLIEQILEGVDAFPTFLNLEAQGMFVLGYYHQAKAFSIKNEILSKQVE